MNTLFSKYLFLISIIFVSLSSCKKDKDETNDPAPDPTAGLTKIAETYVTGAAAKAVLYSGQDLQTGYNEIYTVFYDSLDGSKLGDCHFHVEAMIDINDEDHIAPTEDSDEETPANGLFKTSIVFHKAGKWMLHLHLHNHKSDKDGETELEVPVVESKPLSRLINLGDTLLIAMVKPVSPKTGINDAELLVYQKNTDNTFDYASEYTFEMDPFMPSMNHGSPNNVNPVYTTNGRYNGKVNFTMSGLWQLKITLRKNGNLIFDDRFFEITI